MLWYFLRYCEIQYHAKKKKRFPRYGAGYISHISLNYAARISAIMFTVNNSSISSNIYMNDNLYPNKII